MSCHIKIVNYKDMYDIKTHGDFSVYFDTTQKRNYWVLGYFGGGSVNISDAYEVAKQYAKEAKVSLESVKIDEVLHSRRYKGFKFVYSQEKQEALPDATESANVYQLLTE